MSKLFTPVQLGALALPNRLIMAPMTRSRATNKARSAGALHAQYYSQRASAGLIITEATQISPQGIGYVATPGIHTEAQVEGWTQVTQKVHAAGGRIMLQLWHVGRISHTDFHGGQAPVAPSAITAKGQSYTPEGPKDFSAPRALTLNEIHQIVDDFAHGAQMAKKAGFDGVQLHAANGYLIDQFLRDGSNHRTDQYGGSPENRARFLMEVTEAITGVWGQDRVSVRLSPMNMDFNGMHDSDPETTYKVAAGLLSKFDLAFLEGVTMGAPNAEFHGLLKKHYGGNYVANGGFDQASGEKWLRDEAAHAISYGRPFISNPDLPLRFLEGIDLQDVDPATMYMGGADGYVTYPAATQRPLG